MTKSKYTLKRVDENTVDYYLDDVMVYRHFKDSDGYEQWREYDENGNETHYKDSTGTERWSEYDEEGNETYLRDSYGVEWWSKDNPNNPKNRPPEYVEPFAFTKEAK